MIEQFRQEVYQNFRRRKDAGLDLIDALTSAEQVESPVAVSENLLFRRKFGSVYDVLEESRMEKAEMEQTLASNHPADAPTIAGYEVYATDCTDHEHPEAESLPERTQSRKGKGSPLQIGHRYGWLVRVIARSPSWCMPQSVERVGSQTTDSQVAAEQLKRLDGQSSHLKVVVADSLYCNQYFLGFGYQTCWKRPRSALWFSSQAPHPPSGCQEDQKNQKNCQIWLVLALFLTSSLLSCKSFLVFACFSLSSDCFFSPAQALNSSYL